VSAATSHAHDQDASPSKTLALKPFSGGGRWVFAGGGLGLVCLILTFIGMAMNPKDAGFSYLLAFAYWAGISFTSVILLMIFHATHARWVTVLRRPIEAMAASVAIFLFLFIPLIFVMKHVYVWVDPPDSLGREALKLIAGKAAYLNVKGFVVRTVIYFILAIFISQRLYGWSLKQDATGDVMLLQKQRNLGAGGLPFIGLALTFGAFDWLMSLNPTWFSTVFGVYYFGGSMVAAL
jgi:magnesium-transporting ATPase (P-type)